MNEFHEVVVTHVARLECVPVEELAPLAQAEYFSSPCCYIYKCPTVRGDTLQTIMQPGKFRAGCDVCPGEGGVPSISDGAPPLALAQRRVAMWRGFRDYLTNEATRRLFELQVGGRIHCDIGFGNIRRDAWRIMQQASARLCTRELNSYLPDHLLPEENHNDI